MTFWGTLPHQTAQTYGNWRSEYADQFREMSDEEIRSRVGLDKPFYQRDLLQFIPPPFSRRTAIRDAAIYIIKSREYREMYKEMDEEEIKSHAFGNEVVEVAKALLIGFYVIGSAFVGFRNCFDKEAREDTARSVLEQRLQEQGS